MNKEINRIKAQLKEIEENGLKFYDNHKEIVLIMIKEKLENDLKYFEDLEKLPIPE